MDTQSKVPKMSSQRIRKRYHKTLGTSAINSPMSPPSLKTTNLWTDPVEASMKMPMLMRIHWNMLCVILGREVPPHIIPEIYIWEALQSVRKKWAVWRHINEESEEKWERKPVKKRWIMKVFYEVTHETFRCPIRSLEK